ncbi:MAG: EAL domain-containing protein [Alphaproteobacteria bacterium]|uniref:EAL domain-containing protein n=1 Tax=Candidatus Nitrobium versatile TaxID=2884831 RepID=A0A953M2H2_9BACT|nr:EAL domain-containing protein [Candidatus Nitrobium versatile]
MVTRLRVLVIEDSSVDTKLLIRELKQGGYEPVFKRVDTHKAVWDALREQQWDVVISDYKMPAFDGLEALSIVQESGLDLPFILISGKIDEETAVAAMKAGAHDYITKGKLGRLIPAIERELREAEVRRERTRVEKELQEYHNNLERIVQQRTAEWKTANEQLLLEIEERRRVEEALRESEQRLRRFYESGLIGVIYWDMSGTIKDANDKFLEMVGYTREELDAGKINWMHMTPTEYRHLDEQSVVELKATGVNKKPFEKEYIRKDGTRISILIAGAMLDKTRFNGVAFVLDITERRRAERSLHESKSFLERIMQSVTNAIYVVDLEGRFSQLNQAAAEMSGYLLEELKGVPFSILFDEETLPQIQKLFARIVVHGESIINYEIEIVRKDGIRRLVLASSVPLRIDGEITGVVGAAQDITDRKRMENEIRHLAHHDALTNLPNRKLFMDILHLELAESRRNRKKLAVFFLDLDRFKYINDTLGHTIGDNLLKEVAKRLRHSVRESDTVARIGGDEFNILMANIEHAEDVITIAQKILAQFKIPYLANDNHELYAATSIGISIYPDDSEDLEILFRNADIAMYHAKEQGGNTYQFYSSAMNIRSIERLKMEGFLRQSLTRGELAVYYQPKLTVDTRTILCAEALVRWQHPELGLLAPLSFIPVAEESGFIVDIDEWVLRTVCIQIKSWIEAGLPSLRISVNLSARQFQNPELVSTVAKILEETGVPPDCLDIEITEHVAMSNVERTADRLKELTEMGVHISIDDFGTGYSSLSYLKRFPVGKLKIDKSFIQDIATDPDDRAIISAVISMAHDMGMKVVAEGVETEEQLSFLQATRCDEAQGYLFSEPLSAEEFGKLIAAGR